MKDRDIARLFFAHALLNRTASPAQPKTLRAEVERYVEEFFPQASQVTPKQVRQA